MNINFKTKRLAKCCNNEKEAIKEWGDQYARKVLRRLNELRANVTLQDVSHLPPARLHELEGNRKGTFAVTVKEPVRIILKPDHEPVPLKQDGGIDKSCVTDITILEVEDYHGKRK